VDTCVERHDRGTSVRADRFLGRVIVVTGTLQIPRTRGAVCGSLLVLLGAWGALIPFVGPYFDYGYTPTNTWNYTNARLVFDILPGLGAVIGGLLVLGSAHRLMAMFGGLLAAAGGAWFVLGVPLSATWDGPTVGSPMGDTTTQQVLEYVGFFGGLGVAIVFLAAFASGRFAVVGVREVDLARQAEEPELTAEEEPATTSETAPETMPEAEPVSYRDADETQRIS